LKAERHVTVYASLLPVKLTKGHNTMAFQAAPQGIQVRLQMEQHGVKMENVWNVDYGAPVTPVGLAIIGAAFDGWLTTSYSLLSSSSLKYTQIVCTDISVANGAQDIRVPATSNGAIGSTEAAGNAALVASLRTIHTGRNFRGRTYLAGLAQTNLLDAQHVQPGMVAALNVSINDLLTILTGAGYKLVVLSRWLNNAKRAVALLTEIIAVITDTKIDSQQRRTAN